MQFRYTHFYFLFLFLLDYADLNKLIYNLRPTTYTTMIYLFLYHNLECQMCFHNLLYLNKIFACQWALLLLLLDYILKKVIKQKKGQQQKNTTHWEV